MELRYLRRRYADQPFWVDVASKGESVYHPALVEVASAGSTLIASEAGERIVRDLRLMGFSDDYGPNVRVPVMLD